MADWKRAVIKRTAIAVILEPKQKEWRSPHNTAFMKRRPSPAENKPPKHNDKWIWAYPKARIARELGRSRQTLHSVLEGEGRYAE